MAALPEPVARLLQAANDNDVDAFLAGFTVDGVVDDWGREFAGADAIMPETESAFVSEPVPRIFTRATLPPRAVMRPLR